MPFIETYLAGSDDEDISHFAAIRLRVVGVGDLLPTLYSLDRINSIVLLPLTMSAVTAREPTRLTNFVSQRALLRLETNKLNDFFNIQQILVYVKELYSQYPS